MNRANFLGLWKKYILYISPNDIVQKLGQCDTVRCREAYRSRRRGGWKTSMTNLLWMFHGLEKWWSIMLVAFAMPVAATTASLLMLTDFSIWISDWFLNIYHILQKDYVYLFSIFSCKSKDLHVYSWKALNYMKIVIIAIVIHENY